MIPHGPMCQDMGAEALPHIGGSDGASCICLCDSCQALTADSKGDVYDECICPDCHSDHHGHTPEEN